MTKEDKYPNANLVVDITEIMRDADRAFETIGGSTRHYIRDVFIPMLEEKGFRFIDKATIEARAKQQAIAFDKWKLELGWAKEYGNNFGYIKAEPAYDGSHAFVYTRISFDDLYSQFIEQQNK